MDAAIDELIFMFTCYMYTQPNTATTKLETIISAAYVVALCLYLDWNVIYVVHDSASNELKYHVLLIWFIDFFSSRLSLCKSSMCSSLKLKQKIQRD